MWVSKYAGVWVWVCTIPSLLEKMNIEKMNMEQMSAFLLLCGL